MGLIAVVIIFGFFGLLAHILGRREVERDPTFSKDPEVRAHIIAEFETENALARQMPRALVEPTTVPWPSSPAPVSRADWMRGNRA